MNEKVKKLILLYTDLDFEERKQVRDLIQQYEEKPIIERRTFSEGLSKSLGPTNSRCAYCGK
jgi:hypothetical protein